MAQAVTSLRGIPGPSSPVALMRQPPKAPRENAHLTFAPGPSGKLKSWQSLQTAGVGFGASVEQSLIGRPGTQSASRLRAGDHAVELALAPETLKIRASFEESSRNSEAPRGVNARATGLTDAAVPSGGSGTSGNLDGRGGAYPQSNAELVGQARNLAASSDAELEEKMRSLAAKSAAELAGPAGTSMDGNQGSRCSAEPQFARSRAGPEAAEGSSPPEANGASAADQFATGGEVDFARLARMLTEFERDPSAPRLEALSSIVAGLAENTETEYSRAGAPGMTEKQTAEMAEKWTAGPTATSRPPPASASVAPRRVALSPPNLPTRKAPLQPEKAAPVRAESTTAQAQTAHIANSVVPKQIDRSEYVAMRQRLNAKLSEANSYNRHLRREINQREEDLKTYKAGLSAAHAELKDLAVIAREVALAPAKASTAKINGRFVFSHMATKIEELEQALKEQVAGVNAAQLRDVPVEWYGMAEDVKVMGSFDGWTYGEQLSPETTGTHTRFVGTLRMRPGKYEIKFLVDGEWRLAPEWPQTGSGLTANNLLVVELK